MSWVWLAAAASAQTVGIENDPNYEVYMRAFDALGDVTTPRKETPQILPGMVAVVGDRSGGTLGELASIKRPVVPPHYTEALVLRNEASLLALNEGFVLSFDSTLSPNSEVGLNNHLQALDDEDGAEEYLVAIMSVTNKTPPSPQEAIALPPLDASSPFYDLYTYELTQNGTVVGYLAREIFLYQDASEGYRDSWYFKGSFKAVKSGVSDLVAEPCGPYSTKQQFLVSIALDETAWFQHTDVYAFETL